MSRIANTTALRQREPQQRDAGYLAWLHKDIPCIACLLEGPPSLIGMFTRIEAAHIKIGVPGRAGWVEGGRGKRVSDRRCCALCAVHHRLAGDACDVNQRAFFDRLGLGDHFADFIDALYFAYEKGVIPGRLVVLEWVHYARAA